MTEEVQQNPDLKAFIFQVDAKVLYIGLLDMNDQDDNKIMYNVHSALSITYNNNISDYIITGLCDGLGDHNYIMNLNKNCVIAVITPSDSVINAYQYELEANSTTELEAFLEEDKDNDNDNDKDIDVNILEVKTKQ